MSGAATSDNPWLAQTAVLEEVLPEIDDVATYRFRFADADRNGRYGFAPGQFNMVYLPGVGEVAISLSAGSAGRWDHTIRVAGNTTRAIAQLRPGATLGLRGPYGSSWPLQEIRGCDVVLVAGGIGLAPLRPAVYHLLEQRAQYGRLTLLYGARTPRGLLYTREFADWRARGLEIQTTVDRADDEWGGQVGVVPLLVDRLEPWNAAATALLMCGPEVMMTYSVRSAAARGVGTERMWVSLERNMQCAVGLCGHCQLGPTFVCKNGPVFRQDYIEPYLRVEGL